MSRDRLDDLHEQASGYYLQGDFRSAAETWRRILVDEPLDERALEGVRLCDGLEGGVDPTTRTASSAGGNVAETLLESIEELEPVTAAAGAEQAGASAASVGLLDLSDLADDGVPISSADFSETMMTSPADMAGGGQTPIETSDDHRNTPHEFDFGDLLGDEEVVVVSSEEDEFDRAAESEDDAEELCLSSSAEAELQRRVRELLDSALAAVERGDKDEALLVLGRLEILDEDNEAVRSLQEKIRLEIESERGGGAPLAEETVEGGPEPQLEILNLETGYAEVPGRSEEPPPVAEAPAVESTTAESAPAVSEPQPTDEPAPRPETSTASRRLSRRSAPHPALWIPAAAVLLAGVALMGWHFLGRGGDATEVVEARPAAATPPPTPTADEPSPRPVEVASLAPSSGAPPAEPEPEAEADGTDPLVPDDRPVAVVLAEVLARADSLFDAGDYRAAVVAYDEVLALDPDHARARERLLAAGNRYKDERAEMQEWTNAVSAFEAGEYRQALRAFYRIPEEKRPQDIERYKVNGWYNLGIVSLRAGDCREAITNLYEAQAISPNDPGTITAIELARLCRRGERSTPSYQLAVGMLEVRGLRD